MYLQSISFHPESYPTYEQYPFDQAVFRETRTIALTTPVTLFVGENGTGKSTLLEALSRRCGIHMWRDRERSRFAKNPFETELYRYVDVEWANGSVPGSFFGSDIFGRFAEILDEWAAADSGQLEYFGGQSLVTQSHGQSIMSFFRARYKIKGLYLLDEPETALSPRTQLALLALFRTVSSAGHAQFIIATHSPIIMACPGATIYTFDRVPVQEIGYEETDHYRIYKAFMADRSRYMLESA